jgi:hypothetical protein
VVLLAEDDKHGINHAHGKAPPLFVSLSPSSCADRFVSPAAEQGIAELVSGDGDLQQAHVFRRKKTASGAVGGG